MGKGKLHSAAYNIFVEGYRIKNSEEYSKFENMVYYVDRLGKDLLLKREDLYLSDNSPEALKRNIANVISALIVLANQQNVDMEETLVEVLEKYRKKKQ